MGLIEASISIKLAALNFIGTLQASLSAGPVFLLSCDGTLGAAGTDLGGLMTGGLFDPATSNQILPTDDVHGLALITKDPAAWAAMQVLFRTS